MLDINYRFTFAKLNFDGNTLKFNKNYITDYRRKYQKQPLQVFCETGVLINLVKFTGKHLCCSLRSATLLKKILQHRCFPVNFSKFVRAPFLTEHL